jgi:hypothetical protein
MNEQDFSSSNPKIWASSKTLRDISEAYSSVYEKKEYEPSRDQDGDDDNDFADNMIARMVASGMSREEAIKKVKNKDYNKKDELDEAATRQPPKVRGAKDPKAYMAGRSDAGKRISGNEKIGPRGYTVRGVEDAPVQPGEKPNPYKLSKSEKEYSNHRHNETMHGVKAGYLRVGGSKGLPGSVDEAYETIASYLLENNFVSTIENANIVIENMSSEWLNEILKEETN